MCVCFPPSRWSARTFPWHDGQELPPLRFAFAWHVAFGKLSLYSVGKDLNRGDDSAHDMVPLIRPLTLHSSLNFCCSSVNDKAEEIMGGEFRFQLDKKKIKKKGMLTLRSGVLLAFSTRFQPLLYNYQSPKAMVVSSIGPLSPDKLKNLTSTSLRWILELCVGIEGSHSINDFNWPFRLIYSKRINMGFFLYTQLSFSIIYASVNWW